MRRPGPLLGVVLFLASGTFASCSGSNDDVLVRACRVVVESCHRGSSVGECLDDLGPLAADCLGCVSSHGCDYTVCQSDVPGCRLPLKMIDPGDVIDFGPRPTDAGPRPTDAGSNPVDSGSGG